MKREWEWNRLVLIITTLWMTGWALSLAALACADTTWKHLILDEIIVSEEAVTEPMGTAVGIKKIEKGKNINIPDVLESEPDIDVKRRTLIGDTADSLASGGFRVIASCSTSMAGR